jgi:hypothetical protein
MMQAATTFDIHIAAILIFVISFVVGAVFALWPDKVQEYDTRMSSFFRTPEVHRVFIKGCGLIFLCFAAASLLAMIFS